MLKDKIIIAESFFISSRLLYLYTLFNIHSMPVDKSMLHIWSFSPWFTCNECTFCIVIYEHCLLGLLYTNFYFVLAKIFRYNLSLCTINLHKKKSCQSLVNALPVTFSLGRCDCVRLRPGRWISIHLWAGWLYWSLSIIQLQNNQLVRFFHTITASGYSCRQWSLHSDSWETPCCQNIKAQREGFPN